MRAVRLAESAQEDIERQLTPGQSEDFRRHDLRRAMEALAADPEVWNEIAKPHGSAWQVQVQCKPIGTSRRLSEDRGYQFGYHRGLITPADA